MSDSRKFLVGNAGKRELRNILRSTTDPATTIQSFQQSHSLHTMMSKAFGTVPRHANNNNKDNNKDNNNKQQVIESLDTDSVLQFLFHLGVSQYEVHKRVADALRTQLENEIRKAGTESLLNLLRSCWQHSTTIPELRPVLWAVLKQLGDETPTQVLELLGERHEQNNNNEGNNNNNITSTLKHAEMWHPLPPLLKRLVWEAEWDKRVANQDPEDPKEYLKLLQSTLFGQKLEPLLDAYRSESFLADSANRPFVASLRERRLVTTQRRALTTTTARQNNNNKKPSVVGSSSKDNELPTFAAASKAVSSLRKLLSNGDSPAYRPKLLNAALSLLMAHHGTSHRFVGGASHLYCTLATDILLSGPLPKAYQPVLSLARALDEVVKAGVISDATIAQMQKSLREIYPVDTKDDDNDNDDKNKKKKNASGETDGAAALSPEVKDLLKRVVQAGLDAMKEADPQSLFLNPVTDELAPGYSKVIQKPMCIRQMEETDYLSIQEWDRDVQLMFRNCLAYNTGNSGQWFRGEARRQNKLFKEEILPPAKKLFATELAKVTTAKTTTAAALQEKKRKAPGHDVTPLPACRPTKRKKDSDPFSMPALASMLLCDPFVVRLLVDRVLRSLRIDTYKGATIPVAHRIVPSLLQLLHLSQMSNHLCAIRGKRYMIPGAGLTRDDKQEEDEGDDPLPYASLRQYLPLLLKLFLESEMDKRMASDLQAAAQSMPPRSNVISAAAFRGPQSQVLLALVQGALVHVCQPGNSHESSLAVTFGKFAGALQQLANNNLWNERPFFQSLTRTILRHKAKLGKTTRDAIVAAWMDWLKNPKKNSKKKGSMLSAAHECLVSLLVDWASLGNLLLPRDQLIKFSQEVVALVNETETNEKRKFAKLWKDRTESFKPIAEQYDRMLKALPDAQAKQWKDAVVGGDHSGDSGGDNGGDGGV